MSKWKCTSFGKSGRIYPLLYVAPLPLLGVALCLIFSGLSNEFKHWEKIIVSGFGLFFLVYFFRALQAIRITRSTIQEICIKGTSILFRTFGGETFEVKSFQEIIEGDKQFFSKQNIAFLFPPERNHLILRCEFGEYYISGAIKRFDSLSKALHNAAET